MKKGTVFIVISVAGLLLGRGVSAGSLTIVDSFVPPTGGLSLCDHTVETPGQMDGSGFTWGGYTHATVSGWRGKVNISASLNRLELYSNTGSDSTISANYAGTYFYTVFSSNGTSVADQALALDGIEADIVSVAPGQQIRWLVRDANYEWYLSAPTGVVVSTYALNPAATSWLRVDAAAETEMSELDADAKQAITDPSVLSPGTPDLSAVTGGGMYIESGDTDPATQYNFIMTEMRWTGEPAAVPEPPEPPVEDAIPVVVDVTRLRTINGQLSVVRKNLFNVHAGASSFSAAQEQYLFEDLDVNAGRSFGVIWKMNQIQEDTGARAGYWDLDQMNNQINSAYNSWVAAGSPAHDNTTDKITTSHTDAHYPSAQDIADAPPNGFRTRDHDANAEFVSKYIQMFYPRMTWYEFSNEINGEADELGTTWTDICTLAKTVADRVHADGLGTKFVGFGGKWPAFEYQDFGIWDRDWVEFIDIAGASMDAYSVHLYSRMGPNAEAIMDMINNYSMISIGETRPLMITEFGHLTDTGTFEEKLWRNMYGQTMFFLQFLERGGLMGRSIPFNTANNTTWPSAMLVDSGGTMVFSDMIKLYELWQDFEGDRIEISTGDPDVLAHAVQDGNVVRVAIYNSAGDPVDLSLEYLTGDAGIVSADISRLYWGTSSPEVTLNAAFNPSQTALALSGYETIVLSLQLTGAPSDQSMNEKVTYFGDTMTQSIAAAVPMTVNINGLDDAKSIVTARLRISSGNIGSWIPSAIIVNGAPVEMPADQMGEVSDALRAYEVEVPYYLLASSNAVSVTYASGGGHLAGAVMDVTYGEQVPLDSDGDGLSDEFEFLHDGDPETMDPLYDPFGDGLTALSEFAMGLDPNMDNSASRPSGGFAEDAGSDYFTISYLKDGEADPYLDVVVLRSTNLTEGIGWQSNQTATVSSTAVSNHVEQVIERSTVPVDGLESEFLMLGIRSK